ncbi:putative conjugative transfer protein TraG [Orientia tsutsugamushi str. Ikeda]|uniref:Putative conjugative transfer protein TraG n=1 Tax=Orientia tsutsugamushi (strain Ikeda) TaxID=334380 RepID=B3CU48_ORITI|nr:putative conjugative transfer protein TraG [Orientia tsutsugamushi str. Ikeda]
MIYSHKAGLIILLLVKDVVQNIPNNFGIYYRKPSNLAISFKTCRQATTLIKAAIHKELNEGLLTKFAAAIGVQSDQSNMLSQRLKVMIKDTLKYLQREQQDIHEWMKQAMLLMLIVSHMMTGVRSFHYHEFILIW